jgi:hypothetical protein
LGSKGLELAGLLRMFIVGENINGRGFMITQLPESEGATIGIMVTGKVDQAEEEKWISTFNALIAQHDKINVLVLIDDNFDIGLKAAYEDLKWTFGHLKHIDKLAIVSTRRVIKWLVEIDSPFAKMVNIEEKYFDVNELNKAWAWVKSEWG